MEGSHEAIIDEAVLCTQDPNFKGYIHDVGGPTANFRHPSCQKQLTQGVCPNRQCLFPKPCPNLQVDHKDYLELLRKLRALSPVHRAAIETLVEQFYPVDSGEKRGDISGTA